MIAKEKVECYNCGEEITREEGYEYQEKFLCESCYCDDFFTCEDCGAVVPLTDAIVINRHTDDIKYVCRSCSDNYQRCCHCEEYFSSNQIWASGSDVSVCNRCSSYYSICRECRCIVHEDDVYYYEGEDYCQECYDDLGSAYIEEYGYKPEPDFLGETDEGLYLGVELEVDDGCNLKLTTKRIYDEFSDVYMKHDGSLSSSGFEIVSHPATLDF